MINWKAAENLHRKPADLVGAPLTTFWDRVEERNFFERLGKKRTDYIDLRPCEPMYSFRTPEGPLERSSVEGLLVSFSA
jgi:hypothetical protein